MLLNSQTRAVTVSFAVAALLGLVFAALNVQHAGRVVTGVIFCLVMVVAAVQTAKSSIKWNERGVVGRSTGVTRRLGWPEIAGFEHREGGGLGARLHNGPWVTLMPYPRSPLNKPEQAIAALEAARHSAEQRGRAPQE